MQVEILLWPPIHADVAQMVELLFTRGCRGFETCRRLQAEVPRDQPQVQLGSSMSTGMDSPAGYRVFDGALVRIANVMDGWRVPSR